VLGGIFGEEAGAVIRGVGLLSGVPKGLETGVASDLGDDIAVGAAVILGGAVIGGRGNAGRSSVGGAHAQLSVEPRCGDSVITISIIAVIGAAIFLHPG
jgi:hypothetical protein